MEPKFKEYDLGDGSTITLDTEWKTFVDIAIAERGVYDAEVRIESRETVKEIVEQLSLWLGLTED